MSINREWLVTKIMVLPYNDIQAARFNNNETLYVLIRNSLQNILLSKTTNKTKQKHNDS